MYKLSKYNFFVEYNDIILFYNALTDIVIPIKFSDKDILLSLLNNLVMFQKKRLKLFNKFCDWGFIIKMEFDEISYIKFKNHQVIFNTRNYRLTINPTLDCNMSCWYCTVDAAGVKRPNKRMNDNIISNIKKYVSFLIENRLVDGFFLDWFGGEPMIYFKEVIVPIAMHIKALTKKYNIPFLHHITTNGYLINKENIKTIDEISLNSFQITLDGNKSRHNKIRQHYGNPTFDKIIENINMICDKVENSSITLRINYDRKTLTNISDIIPLIHQKYRSKINISFQKIFQLKGLNGNENVLLKKVKEEFEKAGFDINYWAFRPKSFFTCYSDKYAHAVINYDGNVYKCTARDYSEDVRIGKLKDNGMIDWKKEMLSTMFAQAPFENEICLNCKLLPLCFGPCIQKHYETKTSKATFNCKMKDSELSVETFIITEAKKRNLI